MDDGPGSRCTRNLIKQVYIASEMRISLGFHL